MGDTARTLTDEQVNAASASELAAAYRELREQYITLCVELDSVVAMAWRVDTRLSRMHAENEAFLNQWQNEHGGAGAHST
jgi:hypothetical protein